MKCPLLDVATEDQGAYVRLQLTGPSSQEVATLEWVHGLGGNAVRSGPYTNQKMFPKVDTKRFLVVAHIPLGR